MVGKSPSIHLFSRRVGSPSTKSFPPSHGPSPGRCSGNSWRHHLGDILRSLAGDISNVFHWDSYEILIGYPNFIHISRKQPSEYLLDIPISFIYPEIQKISFIYQPSEYLLDIPISFIYPENNPQNIYWISQFHSYIQKTTLRISIGYPNFIHISRKQPSEYLLDIPISFIYPENNPQNIYWISQFHSYIQKTTLRISIGYPNFIHISRKQPSEYLLDIPISFIYPENNPQNIYWISQFHSYIQKTTLRISIGYPNFINSPRKQPSEYLLDIPISLISPENNPQNIYWISQFH